MRALLMTPIKTVTLTPSWLETEISWVFYQVLTLEWRALVADVKGPASVRHARDYVM